MKNLFSLLFIALIISFTGCKKNDKEEKKKKLAELKKEAAKINSEITNLERELGPATNDENATRQKFVSVQTVSNQSFAHYIEVNGLVESDKNITISAKSAGSITHVSAERGQKVRKGQVLASIDAAIVQKGIDELKSGLELANTIYEKQKNLWSQKIGTEIQYLQAKNNKESLEKKLASLQEQYDLSLIRSTIDGTVDEVFIREGENIAPGLPAFRVVGGTDYKITAQIPESFVSKVSRGNEVEVYIPDLQQTIKSKISNVSSVIGATNRTFSIEVLLQKLPANIKANLVAQVRIRDYSKEQAIVVPINIIQHSEEGEYVFVAEGEVAKRKNVKVGQTYKSQAEIQDGLKPGEKVITAGYLDLVDGQQIKI